MSSLTLPRFVSANVSAVTDRIFVGGDLSYDANIAIEQVGELVDHGVTHIVDCRIEADDQDVWQNVPNVTYLHHGMDDRGQDVPDAWFDQAVGFLQEALADPDSVVLTHCHMGINRGPSLGFALMLAEGWDPIQAMDAVRAARPIAFSAYAEDALAWRDRHTSASAQRRRSDRRRMVSWRNADELDIVNVIRKIRATE